MSQSDYDSPWKEIIERYFPEFMAFFFPDAYSAIDWTKEHTFLDKELQQVVREAETGSRHVDKLVQVNRKGEPETAWVLIHVEVQSQRDPDFAERMYIYHYRLYDRYQRRVASMAVLSDTSPGWRPQQFGYELFGCRVSLDFPMVKLLDYEQDWAALEANANPFALAVMAQLQTHRTRQNPAERYAAKFHLTRLLYQRGYNRQDILELFRFIDWVLTLPTELEQQFRVDLEQLETEVKMQYVTSIERLAMQEGREEGMREMLLDLLQTRFGNLSGDIIERLQKIDDPDTLKMLNRRALVVESLTMFIEDIA